MSEDRKPSLAENVYERLRTAIVEGEYRPNQRLIEAELAEKLDASRTPIRETLQRLQNEGLVGVHRRGWIVREHTGAEIDEVYDVRTPLEGYAARLAAERASDAEIAEIAELNAELTLELAKHDRTSYVRLHDRFHAAIYAAAHTPLLAEVIRVHRHHQFNRRVAHLYSDDQLLKSIEGHALMVKALVARDGETIERITREHLEDAKVATLQLLNV